MNINNAFKKVCIVIFNSKPYIGGAERRFINLYNFLVGIKNRNFDVHLCLIDKKQVIDVNKICNAETHLHIFTNQFKLFKFIKESEIDIIHFPTLNQRLYPLYELLNKKKQKIVFSLNSIELATGIFKNPFQKMVFKLLIQKSSWVDCLYPSRLSYLREIIKSMIKDKDKIPVLTASSNSFIDLSKFSPKFPKRKIIVFAARLIPIKNPILALEAIKLIKNIIRKNSYQFLMCGEGPLKGEIESFIKENKLEDIVKLEGYIDTSRIFPYSSIFLSIQSLDNYPSQSLMEAIACGNYIIASNVGETHNIVKSEFGVLVNLDKDEISHAIISSITELKNDNTFLQIINNERAFAKNNFCIEAYSKHIVDIWTKLAFSRL